MKTNFYKVTYALYMNDIFVDEYTTIKLAQTSSDMEIIHLDTWEKAQRFVCDVFGFAYGYAHKRNYFTIGIFGEDRDFPKEICAKLSFFDKLVDSRDRVYYEDLWQCEVRVASEICEAPNLERLKNFSADLVIEYFKERGLTICPLR